MASKARLSKQIQKQKFPKEIQTEEDLIADLAERKPSFLKFGQEQWIQRNAILDELEGLEQKLMIHGYDDRANRLHYLHSTLINKWEDKPKIFNAAIRFLMDMGECPTSVISLNLSEAKYSSGLELENEGDVEIDEDILRDQLLKKEIIDDILQTSVEINMQYSTDSEAGSDWQMSEEEDNVQEHSKVLEKSSSRIEGTGIPLGNRLTELELSQLAETFWSKECKKALTNVEGKLHKAIAVPVSGQPVISNLVVLHKQFGEYWEWRKQHDTPSYVTKLILEDNDVLREILWQLTTPNHKESKLFNKNWNLKPEIMISSLSQASLSTLAFTYGDILSKSEILHYFISTVEEPSNCNEDMEPPSNMSRVYAFGLKKILLFLNRQIDEIERLLKTEEQENSKQPCTTLTQLTYQLKSYFRIIITLEDFHQIVIPTQNPSPSSLGWLASVNMISTLLMRLNQELDVNIYKFWLFLFIQCFVVFLDELLGTLETLNWDSNECLFIRNADVQLNDQRFWKESIICKPIKSKLKECGVNPPIFLTKLIPKLLTMLKVLEMVNLLNEDKSVDVNLGTLPSRECIINEIMRKIAIHEKKESSAISTSSTNLIDHVSINFIEPEDVSMMAEYFGFMFVSNEKPFGESCAYEQHRAWISLDKFINNVNSIPTESLDKILDDVMDNIFDPYFQITRKSLYKILNLYNVNESVSLFREIILGEREDFAQAVDLLAKRERVTPDLSYEDERYRNQFYQKLLNECYPEGRENFTIEFLLSPNDSLNYRLVVQPHFPINLILTTKCINAYLAISRQLHLVRKSLWALNSLTIQSCKGCEGVQVKRLQLFRFAVIQLLSSYRTFLLLKIFSTGFDWTEPISPTSDLDLVIKAHEDYLRGIETQILQDKFLNDVVLRKLTTISNNLYENWETGKIKLNTMVKFEDILLKCWTFLYDFSISKHTMSLSNELAAYVGPIPKYLTKQIQFR